MSRWAHDLTYDECDAWRGALRLEWDVLLKLAGVKSHKDTIKNRWNKGEAPKDRAKIRATLEHVEQKKGTTPIGATILGLEDWLSIGESLAKKPEIFLKHLEQLREIARTIEKAVAVDKAKAESDAAMIALASITPAPSGKRK
jgi:hypothetical protein